MSNNIGISRNISITLGNAVTSPLTLGFWKPMIILPLAIFTQLSPKQVEAVITHELYHVKRNDYLLNIFLTVSEVILFFNPFARMMCGIVKKERENSCDDKVVAMGYDAWDYSQALYILGRHTYQHNLAVAATGSGKEYLLQRIKRMVSRTSSSPSVLKPVLAFFLCLFVAGIAVRNDRQPQVLAAQPLPPSVAQVVYNSEAKIEAPIPPQPAPKPLTSTRKITKKIQVLSSKNIKEIIAPPPPQAPLPVEPEPVVASFVVAPEILEFTIIDQATAEVPEVVNCEKPQPYVPSSSFYFTQIDTTAGKKIITL